MFRLSHEHVRFSLCIHFPVRDSCDGGLFVYLFADDDEMLRMRARRRLIVAVIVFSTRVGGTDQISLLLETMNVSRIGPPSKGLTFL